MARLNIAMLGEQQQEETQASENMDLEALQLNQAQSDVDSTRMVIDESKDLSDSLGSTTDTIDQMQTVPDAVVQVAQEQLKHCIKRTGLNMSSVNAAMENKKGKEEIVKNLRMAKESLDKSISIAQEGLWDKIKNKFDRVFTSRKSLAKQMDVASRNYDSKGQKEGVLTEKYLSVYLNTDNKAEATGDDAIKVLQVLDKLYNGEDVIRTLDKMIEISNNVIDTVAKHNANPSGDELSKVVALANEVRDTKNKIDDLFSQNKVSRGGEASLTTCTPGQKNEIIRLSKNILSDNAVERKMKVLLDKIDKMYAVTETVYITDIEGRVVDQRVKDSVNSVSADSYELVWDVVEITGSMETMIFNVVHSAVRYIELSTYK